jgi:bilirubin oxidase
MQTTHMKKVLLAAAFCIAGAVHAQYNTLWIPDTISGTSFTLNLNDTSKQFFPGPVTATEAVNGSFWGPTLFINKGDSVHMTVNNNLMDTTTIHWHGMHLPAVMDGGPHQPIPPGTTWSPYWKMDNHAATYWYHPHMHMMALHQITQGLGGFLIVRDSAEAALNLPRTYGSDDIPLALTDRRFTPNNVLVDATYGDTMLVNGTLNPQHNVPAQIVRFRILNAATERCYNLGFSDNRTFYVIGNDGGLVDTPVAVTRVLLCSAERVEILVNFSGQQSQSFDLMAYNQSLPPGVPGFEGQLAAPPILNALGARDFNILHLNVMAQTANPVTAVPAVLVSNSYWSSSNPDATRTVTISDTTISGAPAFLMNHHIFDMNYIDYVVPLNNLEVWNITNSSNVIGHPFHIHDIEFHILNRNGNPPKIFERGWKDVVFVAPGETVSYVTKFTDFADTIHPFMFHCHIAAHEDGGLMGQFVVADLSAGISEIKSADGEISIFPNPSENIFNIEVKKEMRNAVVEIFDMLGEKIFSEPFTGLAKQVFLNAPAGIYMVRIKSNEGEQSLRVLKQ